MKLNKILLVTSLLFIFPVIVYAQASFDIDSFCRQKGGVNEAICYLNEKLNLVENKTEKIDELEKRIEELEFTLDNLGDYEFSLTTGMSNLDSRILELSNRFSSNEEYVIFENQLLTDDQEVQIFTNYDRNHLVLEGMAQNGQGVFNLYTSPGTAGPWTLQGSVNVESGTATELVQRDFPISWGNVKVAVSGSFTGSAKIYAY